MKRDLVWHDVAKGKPEDGDIVWLKGISQQRHCSGEFKEKGFCDGDGTVWFFADGESILSAPTHWAERRSKASKTAPKGFVLVPLKPDKAMCEAAWASCEWREIDSTEKLLEAWEAMVSAAPKQGSAAGDSEKGKRKNLGSGPTTRGKG